MTTHVMIDIETLGTSPGSVILSIGACTFNAAGIGATFYQVIDMDSCIKRGLTINPSTVQWWMRQSDDARFAVFGNPDRRPIEAVLSDLNDWLDAVDADRVWCHGATFDVPLIDAAAKACGGAMNWKFYNIRCTRTLFELAGVEVKRNVGTHHNALDDAINQANAAIEALTVLA